MQSLSKKLNYIGLVVFQVILLLVAPALLYADQISLTSPANVDIVSEGRRATAIEENPPAYPQEAKSRLIEGWVKLRYVVNPDGTTSEISIIESSAPDLFDKAAIDAVRRFRYEPAIWNGFPAADIILDKSIFFHFRISDGEVGRDFYSLYRSATNAINKGDLEKAERYIRKLEEQDEWKIAEICYLDILKGDFWRLRDEPEESLRFYNRALVVAPVHAKSEIYEILLRRALAQNAASRNLAAALQNYHDLTELRTELAPDDPARKLAEKIQQLVDGETPLTSSGSIQYRCEGCSQLSSAWNQKLLREKFTVENVQGEVSEVKITCGNSYISFVYEPDTAWDVSSRGSDCSVIVLGEEGTTFSLVEL